MIALLDNGQDLEDCAAEIERLRAIEAAARCFIKEADDYPRYVAVRTWATPEADPYLKLRAALDQPKGDEK